MPVLCTCMRPWAVPVTLPLALVLVLAFGVVPRAQAKDPAPVAPPPMEMPLDRLHPDAVIAVSLAPGSAVAPDALWVPNRAAGTVARVGVEANTLTPPVAAGRGPCASLVVAFGSVWVPLCHDGTLARIDAKSLAVSAGVPARVADENGSIAAGVGSVWMLTDRRGVLARFDPDTNQPVAEIYVGADASSVAFADDTVWVTSERDNLLTRIDAHTNQTVETITVGPRPGRLAIGEGGIWSLNRGDGTVSRVDPKTNTVVATIALGSTAAAGDLAVGEGAAWVSAPGIPLIRIDARTNRITHRFTGPGGGAVVSGHGSIWVLAAPDTTWRLDPALVSTMRPD